MEVDRHRDGELTLAHIGWKGGHGVGALKHGLDILIQQRITGSADDPMGEQAFVAIDSAERSDGAFLAQPAGRLQRL